LAVAEIERPDGAKIHYEVRGSEGPAIVLASYFGWLPGVFEPTLERIADAHRIVTYHLRGTGDSSRERPIDMETDSADLEAVIDVAGGPAVVLALADSNNRAAHVGARRPDLVAAVACVGSPPFSLASFGLSDSMIASKQTVEAFQGMMESNYRAALRHMLTGPNPQLSEDELRARIDRQVEFCPGEVALGRIRAWTDDDPEPDARALGDRLWVLTASDAGGPWYPGADEIARLTAEQFPEARLEAVEPGLESNPERGAEVLARIAAPLRAGEAGIRK
jgi:pimeloyl-ACP methyl ester carboxylesterase